MNNLKKRFKVLVRAVLDVFSLIYGLLYYYFNKSKPIRERTPQSSYLSMIRLFCLTSGRSNDVMNRLISWFDKPIALPDRQGILGNLSESDLQRITKNLDENGFHVIENAVPAALIEKFTDFALNQECTLRRLDEGNHHAPLKAKYDRHAPQAAVYDLALEDLISNIDVQSLLRDHSILSVAQAYLRTSPKVDYCASWWSTAYAKQAQSNAAQMYHFDMDRFKWLKFFMFLTDVTLENGPHVFIQKSHHTGAIPKPLLQAGYSRHADKDVEKYFPASDVKVFTAKAGTILVEDTRGMHKATHLIKGERLVLELTFCNSLFGAITAATDNARIQDQALLSFAQQHQKIFKLYPSLQF